MRSWRWYSKLLFALLVAAFAYFVWPTPWMYFIGETPVSGSFPIRIHRLTGKMERYEWPTEEWLRPKDSPYAQRVLEQYERQLDDSLFSDPD
jgi:hypothetical protein